MSVGAPPLRVALAGIDGAGKSRLAEALAATDDGVQLVYFPRLHTRADVPCAELSRDVATLLHLTGEASCGEGQAAAVLMAATLMAPTEAFVVDAFEPSMLVYERHPLVDIPVYIAHFRAASASSPPWSTVRSHIHERLAALRPRALQTIASWRATFPTQSMEADGVEAYVGLFRYLSGLSLDALVCRLEWELGLTFPDEVILLDVEPSVALARIQSRGRTPGRHETLAALRGLRREYHRILRDMMPHRPRLGVRLVQSTEVTAR